MYHETTYKQVRRLRMHRLLAFVTLVAIAVAIVFGVLWAQAQAREQAVLSLRDSVLTAAKQCCAVEGFYPSSLGYLEDNYGLTVNHNDYVVSYEWFADNVLPSVVVTAR